MLSNCSFKWGSCLQHQRVWQLDVAVGEPVDGLDVDWWSLIILMLRFDLRIDTTWLFIDTTWLFIHLCIFMHIYSTMVRNVHDCMWYHSISHNTDMCYTHDTTCYHEISSESMCTAQVRLGLWLSSRGDLNAKRSQDAYPEEYAVSVCGG